MAASTPDTKTDNGAAAFSTTSSAQVDLFFGGFVRGNTAGALHPALEASWRESPERTLQILFQARDCRGGKGERAVVYEALLWLRQHKPLTYKANLRGLVAHGFFKDLLQIAKRAHQEEMPTLGDNGELFELEVFAETLRKDQLMLEQAEKDAAALEAQDESSTAAHDEEDGQVHGEAPMELDGAAADAASPLKRRRVGANASVSLSLAAKWAPSANSHFDRPENGQLGKRLRKLLFDEPEPKADGPNVRKVAAANYRRMLSRLRAHLKLVEHKICAREWDDIDYSKVPSRASMLYRKVFRKHDEERYAKFVEKVGEGTATIHATTLHPHDITSRLSSGGPDDTLEVQWTQMVADLNQECTLQGTLAVVDVSGSMMGTPMNAALALGLMTAQVNAAPWKDKFITFSAEPEWLDVSEDDTLHAKLARAARAPWGMNTNLEKVFSLILTAATSFSVPEADMPKRLVILSDMQFDQCVTSGHTAFQDMQAKYKAAGYKVPHVVFWNLAAAVSKNSFPVRLDEEGVSLVSGFSATMLKAFVKDEVANPVTTMLDVIEKYASEVTVVASEA